MIVTMCGKVKKFYIEIEIDIEIYIDTVMGWLNWLERPIG